MVTTNNTKAPELARPGAVENSGQHKKSAVDGPRVNNGSEHWGGVPGNRRLEQYIPPAPEPMAGAGGGQAITVQTLEKGILAAGDLRTAEVPPRENICGTWFKQGDLGFLFGPRGLGKTWLAMDLACGISEGRAVGPWRVSQSRKVLYVDGEMPLDGLRDRSGSLTQRDGMLTVLNHEWLFSKTDAVLNLSDKSAQGALLSLCRAEGIEVLVLDNLSCLFSGVAENDADAWEMVLPWLLKLRRSKVAVVIVHHANRAGQHMRGTSRREDAAFWVLRLEPTPDHARDGDGAQFISRFTKHRQGTQEEVEPLEWHYEPDGTRTRITYKQLKTIEEFRQWIREGLTSCTDIAEEMGISKGHVAKLAKRAVDEGWLKIDGRNYRLIET